MLFQGAISLSLGLSETSFILKVEIIGQSRIPFGLIFIASPGAHLFILRFVFICMWMKTNFHAEGRAPGLALKKRPKVIRKWPITWTYIYQGTHHLLEVAGCLLPSRLCSSKKNSLVMRNSLSSAELTSSICVQPDPGGYYSDYWQLFNHLRLALKKRLGNTETVTQIKWTSFQMTVESNYTIPITTHSALLENKSHADFSTDQKLNHNQTHLVRVTFPALWASYSSLRRILIGSSRRLLDFLKARFS